MTERKIDEDGKWRESVHVSPGFVLDKDACQCQGCRYLRGFSDEDLEQE